MKDRSFTIDEDGLKRAVDALSQSRPVTAHTDLPDALPARGIGETAALDALAPVVLSGAQPLGADHAFAHMDPPTPWVTWATTLWNASLNQNLLHPDVAPVARDLEAKVVRWIAPFFGMDGGHMTPGSTLANLTALWAAREITGARHVIASKGAHMSAGKAAHILGLSFTAVDADEFGRLKPADLPSDLSDTVLVLTAGTTSAGAIDDLGLTGKAAWTHVDAAWAGPLRFSDTHKHRLDGIETADSVAVSAHKWLFQPKESGLILFRDTGRAHPAIRFGGAYLQAPNVGVLGSHGAIAVPLMATLMAWGREGLAERIDRSMDLADTLWRRLNDHPKAEVYGEPETGVILWRPTFPASNEEVKAALPSGSVSTTSIGDQGWLRHVAANPNADIEHVWAAISAYLDRSG